MVEITLKIIENIESFLTVTPGKGYEDYCIGTTNDPKLRMFTAHNVSEEDGYWMYEQAALTSEANAVEKIFIKKGMKGDPGNGGRENMYVYCYLRTEKSVE